MWSPAGTKHTQRYSLLVPGVITAASERLL